MNIIKKNNDILITFDGKKYSKIDFTVKELIEESDAFSRGRNARIFSDKLDADVFWIFMQPYHTCIYFNKKSCFSERRNDKCEDLSTMIFLKKVILIRGFFLIG